jgi:Ca2+-binding RTX toxin-like protein
MNPKTTFRPHFDALESRLVPAGFHVSQGVLYIQGDIARSNVAEVSGGSLNNPYVTVKLTTYGPGGRAYAPVTYNPGVVRSIRFDGGNKGDYFGNHTDITSKAFGYGGDDILHGGRATDVFYGGAGNDRLDGKDGADYLDGGDNDDWIFGGNHNDWLIGGYGADVLYGGAGSDVLIGGAFNVTARRYYHDGVSDSLNGGDGSSRTDEDYAADVFVAEWYTVRGRRTNREATILASGDRYDNP